jgi:hypothetical protein
MTGTTMRSDCPNPDCCATGPSPMPEAGAHQGAQSTRASTGAPRSEGCVMIRRVVLGPPPDMSAWIIKRSAQPVYCEVGHSWTAIRRAVNGARSRQRA